MNKSKKIFTKDRCLHANLIQTLNPRMAAWMALKAAFAEENFASSVLEKWKTQASPPEIDFRFAQELTYGCLRLAISLDYFAEQLTSQNKLSLKMKERILIRMGIYQCYYMTKIPRYAALNETVELSRKLCHERFSSFLNAILRKLSHEKPLLPHGNSLKALSIQFSYSEFFIKKLLNFCTLEQAKEILQAGNIPSLLMYRIRREGILHNEIYPHVQKFYENPPMGLLKDSVYFSSLIQSKDFYIQNITPAYLIKELCKQWDKLPPKNILDLCASPGGKLIAVHDHFPAAQLYANDVTKEKINKLSQNLQKYGLAARLSCYKGQDYPSDVLFNIIIIDAPCSNSGVLNKRPEARWRLTERTLAELKQTQTHLVEHALSLLKQEGEIWFMTCSILPEENEDLIKILAQKGNLSLKWQKRILPTKEGWDGGFACALTRAR